MNPRSMIVAGAAGVAIAAGAALFAAERDSGARAGSPAADAPAGAATTETNPDLTGYWKLDPSRSVFPARPDRGPRGGRMQRTPGGPGRDQWRRGGGQRDGSRPRHGAPGNDGPRRGGPRNGEGAPGRGGTRRLPDVIHVTQTERMISFEDSTGAVFQEIAIAASPEAEIGAPGSRALAGAWAGGKLRVERPAWRDVRVSETIGLEDGGLTLVIVTRMPGRDSMPARELKRVYRKVTEWE